MNRQARRVLFACFMSCVVPLSAAENSADGGGNVAPASKTGAGQPNSEIEQLKQMLADQQRQINELRQALAQQKKETDSIVAASAGSSPAQPASALPGSSFPSLGEVASTTGVVPFGQSTGAAPLISTLVQVQPAAPALNVNDLNTRLNAVLRNLGGFRFSGDFRYRFDLQDRSGNSVAGPLQNARSRYRLRFNMDKDLFYKDSDERPLAHAHIQLSTAPYGNPLTNDTDYTGFGTKAPFSVAEAFMDFMPLKGLTLRIGRTQELFADNRQFQWDDDVRFNGFHETYRWSGKNGLFAEIKGGQYILTNPNVTVVPANSPFLTAGYALGQRVPSADLFDQGITIGTNLGAKWRTDWTFSYSTVREPNQIQLASVNSTVNLFTVNPVLGATLTGNLPQTGNATTTAGGAIYTAGGFDVLHYGANLNYTGTMWKGHNFPFQLFLQGTHNKGADNQNNGYMLGAAIGQAARLGDVQFQYAYFYKPANAFVSQFTDDDVGTATGVNIKDSTIRVNFGLTRWLAWENRLFIQHGIARSAPAHNFFVPLPQGYNTLFRYQSHLSFTF